MKLFRGRNGRRGVERNRGATYLHSDFAVPAGHPRSEYVALPSPAVQDTTAPDDSLITHAEKFRTAKKNQGFRGIASHRFARVVRALDQSLRDQDRDGVWKHGAKAALARPLAEWQGYWKSSGMLPLLMAVTVPYYGTLIREEVEREEQQTLGDACLMWPMQGLNLFLELTKHFYNQEDNLVALPEHHPVKRRIRRASYRYSTPCLLRGDQASLSDWLRAWRHMGVLDRFLATAESASVPMLPVFSHCEIMRPQTLSFLPGLDLWAHPTSEAMLPVDAKVTLSIRVPSIGGHLRSILAGETYMGRSGDRYFCHNPESIMRVAVTAYGLVKGIGDAIHPLSEWESIKRHSDQMVIRQFQSGNISQCEKNMPVVHLADLMPGTGYAWSPSGATLRSTISSQDAEITSIVQRARLNLGMDEVYPLVPAHLVVPEQDEFFRSAKCTCPALPHDDGRCDIQISVDAAVLATDPSAGLDYHIPINALLLEIIHSLGIEGVMIDPAAPAQLKADRRTLRVFRRLIATFGNAGLQPVEIELFIKGLLLDVLSSATSHFGYRYQLVIRGASYYSIAVVPVWLSQETSERLSEQKAPAVSIHPSLAEIIKSSPDITRLIARSAGLDACALQTFMTQAVRALREASLESQRNHEVAEGTVL